MKYPSIEIAGHKVRQDFPSFVIAEIGQAHEGSLGILYSYIDAIAETGIEEAKFRLQNGQIYKK